MRLKLLLLPLLMISLNLSAQNLTRCQCTYNDLLGDCQARVEQKEKWFKVISNTQQCSKVDWYIDGDSRVTIVTDGAEMEEWLGQNKSPKITILSCRLCKDSQISSSTRENNREDIHVINSETTSTEINQTNSNNTYIDNSQVLSNNNISFFSQLGNDYSSYMNDEAILYLNGYGTVTFGGNTQAIVGLQLGVYEDFYLLAEYGHFSQGDLATDIGEEPIKGKFNNFGVSYHFYKNSSDTHMMSLDFIARKMTNIENSELDYDGSADVGFIIFTSTHFKTSYKRGGFSWGLGIGEDIFIFKAGLSLRYL